VLLRSTSGVKGDADDDEHNGEHSNGSDKFHGYNPLIFKMRRVASSMQDHYTCTQRVPALSKTTGLLTRA
jgi:hypothetical protein